MKLYRIKKIASKNKAVFDDAKSLFNYYILRKRKIVKPSIDVLLIQPSTFCNGNCGFCANRYLEDKREVMPFDTFKKVLDQYINLGGKMVALTPSPGEALLDPDFFNKVKYCRKRGIKTTLYSNGLLLGKYFEDFLNNPIDDLHIDLGDIDEELDAKVFGITKKSSLNRIDTLEKFVKEVDERKIKMNISLEFRGMRKPKEIIKSLEETTLSNYYGRDWFKVNFLQVYDSWGEAIKNEDLLGNQTMKRCPKIKKYPCKGLYTISILPNGNLRLCGCRFLKTMNDELVIGNIHKNSLSDLIKCKKWKQIIESFPKNKHPKICNKCSFYRGKIQ